MYKKIISVLLIIVLCSLPFTGCNTVDILDEQVGNLASDYIVNTNNTSDITSVLDTLDLMLDQYVSGLQKPDIDDIVQTTVDPSDDNNPFDSISSDCNTIDDMEAVILQALTNTEGSVEFTIDSSVYSPQVIYDLIFNQICEEYMIETLGMHEYYITTMVVSSSRTAVKLDFTYLDGKYTLSQIKDIKNQTLSKAKEIVRDLDLANKNEYDCVYEINKYLCDNCVYPDKEPYTNESHTPYGALIQNSAVCEGYARAAQLLFSLAGLNSYYVTGDTSQGGHAWNLVQVGGNYYQLDITWNDADIPNHTYFLVTDDFMSLSRTWDRKKYPASATIPYS